MVGLYEGGADTHFTPWDLTWVPPIYPPCRFCRPFSQHHLTAVWDNPTSGSQPSSGRTKLTVLSVHPGVGDVKVVTTTTTTEMALGNL